MGSKSASLLTKKQRSRIRDGFADLDEEKTRRDQGRIRDRLESGLADFSLLVDYPDRQLELAVDDCSEEELRTALADATLFVERVRELEGFDRDDVLVRARARAEDAAADAEDVATLRRLDLRTAAEIRRDAEDAVRDQVGEDRWDRRVNGLLKLAGAAALPLLAVFAANWATGPNLLSENVVVGVTTLLTMWTIFVAIAGALLIRGAQALKHDVVPGLRSVRADPAATLRAVGGWLRRPGQTLRDVWESL